MRKFPVLLMAVLALSACEGAKKQLEETSKTTTEEKTNN